MTRRPRSSGAPVGEPGSFRLTVAEIQQDGINPYVTVPPEIADPVWVRADGRVRFRRVGQAAPVLSDDEVARLEAIQRLAADGWFRSTLVRREAASWLFLDQYFRKSARVDVGDPVSLDIESDTESGELAVPEALQSRLDTDVGLAEEWAALSPSRRKEILSYLGFLKSPEALARNVEKVLRELHGG